MWIHVGSLAVLSADGRIANRTFLINPAGDVTAKYDKIHMFDVDLANGESYRESHTYQPGSQAVIADLPWGRAGLTICYDVRFPALYSHSGRGGCAIYRRAVGLYPQDRPRALACIVAGAGD